MWYIFLGHPPRARDIVSATDRWQSLEGVSINLNGSDYLLMYVWAGCAETYGNYERNKCGTFFGGHPVCVNSGSTMSLSRCIGADCDVLRRWGVQEMIQRWTKWTSVVKEDIAAPPPFVMLLVTQLHARPPLTPDMQATARGFTLHSFIFHLISRLSCPPPPCPALNLMTLLDPDLRPVTIQFRLSPRLAMRALGLIRILGGRPRRETGPWIPLSLPVVGGLTSSSPSPPPPPPPAALPRLVVMGFRYWLHRPAGHWISFSGCSES